MALPASLVVGLVLIVVPGRRAAGAWVAGATVLAALVEVGLALTLVIADSQANPDWDLS